jgi:hypothetical protein
VEPYGRIDEEWGAVHDREGTIHQTSEAFNAQQLNALILLRTPTTDWHIGHIDSELTAPLRVVPV